MGGEGGGARAAGVNAMKRRHDGEKKKDKAGGKKWGRVRPTPRVSPNELTFRVQGRLHLEQFLPPHDPKPLDAVLPSPFHELVEHLPFSLVRRDDQRSVELISEPQLAIQLGEHLIPRPAVPRVHAPRRIVVPRVDDARVALRRALGDVVGRFEEEDAQVVPAELARDRSADASRAHDDDVVHGIAAAAADATAGIIAVDDDAGVAGTGAWARRSGGTAGAVGGVRLVGAGAILEVHPMAGVVCALDPCVRICCTVDK